MKIAVPINENNLVDDHFGHCSSFNVFSISGHNEILDLKEIPSLQGCGCKSNIAEVLAADGVTIMLAGGIGDGAINVLKRAGIIVLRGCTGDSAEVVKHYLLGALKDSGESCYNFDIPHAQDTSHKCSH